MSISGSNSSMTTGSTTFPNMLSGNLPYIQGYHFTNTMPILAYNENVDIVSGYRISDKSPVVAKVSSSSVRLEREFYIMKKLYQYNDGPSHLVRPLECLNLSTGLTVAIYSDEGQKSFFINHQHHNHHNHRSDEINHNDSATSSTSSTTTEKEPAIIHNGEATMSHDDDGYFNSTISCDLGTFLRFAIKCLSSLEYIHKHDVIHGEIRPEAFQWNGTDDSPVKLWNFGSGTKSLESCLTAENWRKTTTNMQSMELLQSWLMYMSPEQTGRTTYTPDHRSDLYSLGAMFFTLLTGRDPFDGGPLDIVNGILSKKLPLVHELQLEVPLVLSQIIEKMTNKAPDDRYTSAHGIKADLETCLRFLKTSQASNTESIPMFPLGQHDIVSVFTLPKTIYGRQDVLSELIFFIERCADLYKPSRVQSVAPPNSPYNTTTAMQYHHHPHHRGSGTPPISSRETATDLTSEYSSETSSNPDPTTCTSSKSNTSPSYSSGGMEENDMSSISSKMTVNNSKGTFTTIVAVYGTGGIGKSTLFTEVLPTARQNGYVGVSKFDSRNKVPYSAVTAALSHILQQILSEEENEISSFYEHLKISLGPQYSNIGLITDFVPEFKTLLDLDPTITKQNDDSPKNDKNIMNDSKNNTKKKNSISMHHTMDDIEARTRFHNLYVEIFRAITHWRMTTLFLDDLHQADDPSLELLESLILSRVRLLIFIAYRDQEVTEKLAELLKTKIANVHFIQIEALGMDPLIDFICDTLHRPRDVNRDDIIPFAEIIYKRTKGNAFYVAQLLRTLERKKLIFYDWESNQWRYDLREVEDATMLDENDSFDSQQLDFMVARLRELPSIGRSILKWASFVGDTFSWDTVKNLVIDNEDNNESDDDDYYSINSERTIVDDTTANTSDSTEVVSLTSNTSENDNNDSDNYNISSTLQSPQIIISASPTTSSGDNRRGSHTQFRRKTSIKSTSSLSGNNDPISGLHAVLQEGYIMSIGGNEFKWSHDRISAAAAELVNPSSRSKIHMKIAEYMMEEEKEVDIFLVADHLLKCEDLLMTMDDKTQYRDILIESGNKGRTSGAHRMAFAYYMCAIRLGDLKSQWIDDKQYHTTLLLYTNAATLSWAVGQYDKTEELLEAIFKNSRTPSDRIHAYRIQARYYFGCQLHEKGRATLFRCMDELSDERACLDTSDEGLESIHNEIEELVETMGVEKILALPTCDDLSLIGTLGVMEELLTLSYWSEQKREMYYWACRILKLSLTKGVVGGTGNACNFAGLGYVMLYQKYTFAEKLGKIGIALADIHGSQQEKGRAYSLYPAFLILWKHHHREAFQYFRTGMDYSLAAGDRIYVAFHQIHICNLMFYNGYNVADTLRDAEQSFEDIHSWSASIDMNSFAMCVIRTCKALQGQTYTNTPYVFDGDDGFSDAHFLEESCKQSTSPALVLNWYESFKMIPLVLYDHIDTAIKTGYQCYSTIGGHPCHRHTRMMLWYFSLALIEKCREDTDRKEDYMDQIRKNQELQHEYAVHSPINYAMYWTSIEAELAGFGDSPDVLRAGRLYEDALNQAREGNWYFELSIIHERTGAFYYRVGLYNTAFGYIKKSIDMYMGHGSYGKARYTSTKYAKLLSDFSDDFAEPKDGYTQTDTPPSQDETPMPLNKWNLLSSAGRHELAQSSLTADVNEPYVSESISPVTTEQTLQCLDIVDMASILKSSHVISSEVRFDNLLISMLNIIFENSGADCGAIIVKDDKFGVCAYGCQNQPIITYDPPKPLNEADHLVPSKIINHTIHTGERIFIHNIKKDSRFAVGDWFERVGEKAVICMPIIHKYSTVGCLLIEGPVGAFTQRHIMVLSLLCQQMGISTTNAFLFKSVQRATMANMRMIEMQKQALEEARRSKEAAVRATRLREIFLANMSHEIRTPFAGFYGMISLLSETDLDSEQRDLVKTAKESCEMLLRLIDDLLNFSKLQAGKVSLDLSEVIVEDIITDVVEMLIPMALQKQINITYNIASDVPPVVMADANRLRQIIINLLGNAIKFTHEGEITIRCSIKKKNTNPPNNNSDGNDDNNNGDDDGDNDANVSLLFEVIDSGIGISEEQRKALFVPFSQVDGSTTRKYGGTGLGLSICLQLVELMSGNIDVKSEAGKGSNFFFDIKTTRVSEQEQGSINIKYHRRAEFIQNLLQEIKDRRVLVAGQHRSTVTMVQQLLPGIKVDGACTVEELLACQETDYSIMVVGLFMAHDPEFDTWANHLKRFLKRARCILIMHYPTGTIGKLLGSNNNNPHFIKAAAGLPLPDSNNNNQQNHQHQHQQLEQEQEQQKQMPARTSQDINPANVILNATGIEHNQRAVVRIAVPLRQKALLRAIVETLQQTSPPSSPTSIKRRPILKTRRSSENNKPRDPTEVISSKERELFSQMRILAAEDNPVAQKLLYKQLTRLGFKVDCANNGFEAVEAWTSHPSGYYSMGFFDHHMPKCDGVEATKRIRDIEIKEKRDNIFPIVALTADIQDSARDFCMGAGMTEYLTKPMNQKILTDVLRRTLL